MNRKLLSMLLALTLVMALFTAGGPAASAEGETYTYHGTYSSVSTWSPTDWEISSEYDMLGYPPAMRFELGAAVLSNTGPDAIGIIYEGREARTDD